MSVVAVYRDSLSLIHSKASGKCCVWVMEYGVAKSWVKEFNIEVNERFWKGPFGFRENGDVLLAIPRKNHLGEIVSYDTKNKQMKNLGICRRFCYFHKGIYVESLVLLGGLSSCKAGVDEGIKEELQEHAG